MGDINSLNLFVDISFCTLTGKQFKIFDDLSARRRAIVALSATCLIVL